MNTARIEKGIRTLCMTAALLVAAPFASAETKAADTAFTMAVFEDQAYGKTVLSGQYDRAINRLSGKYARFESQTNLCVALAKSNDLDAAMNACDSAVVSLQSQKSRYERRVRHGAASVEAFESNLSIALSNQGVLLAISGDYDEARQNFRTALQLNQNVAAAQQNMRRLEQIVP